MVTKKLRYLKLYKAFFKNCLIREMEFRSHFIIQNIVSAVWALIVLVTFLFIFNHVSSVNGWDLHSMLLLTAIYFLVDRIFDSLFEINLWDLTTLVNTGNLDTILTKPVSSQFMVSLRKFSFSMFFSNLAMIGLIIYLIINFYSPISFIQIISFLILIICSIVITYSLWFISVLPIFWWGRLDNIHHLFRPFHQLGRVPIDVTGSLKPFFTYIFPLAFVSTIPAQAIIGNLSYWLLFYGIIISIVLLVISNKLWNFSLRYYTSASS
ncbi:MAG: ABC-2 family transporter protein [Candidatus Beckwithbacteria bacterium]